MVFALDPRIPSVWRTPDSIQFGVDEPVLVLDGVSIPEEVMLAAVANGVTEEGLRLVAERSRAEDGETERLIERLRPVLLDGRPAQRPALTVLIDGTGATADALSSMLEASGAEVLAATAATGTGAGPVESVTTGAAAGLVDAVVIVASYAVEPQRHVRWLRRDVPHLPIVYSDGGVTVGPFVRPGRGPCLRCVDLHRTDADPAWPAMATQLHTREPPGETPVAASAAAARAAGLLLGRREEAEGGSAGLGQSARLGVGEVDWVSRVCEPHPECGCLGLPP